MKTLIYQTIIKGPRTKPGKWKTYVKCSSTVERYANNIGADYRLYSKQYFDKSFPIHFENFRLFADSSFDVYDKIMFVDGDVFARNTDIDIFQFYNDFTAQAANIKPELTRKHRPELKISKNFFNSGIMMFTRNNIEQLKPYYQKEMNTCKRVVPGRDQLALNKLAITHFKHYYTPFEINHCCYLREDTNKQAILVHLAGRNRHEYSASSEEWDSHFEV